MRKLLLIALLLATSLEANSATCTVDNAKVTSVFQWDDGSIFVVFDRPTNCACSIKTRLAFHKNEDEKFFISAALTAYTTGKFIYARGEDTGCPVHGNTAKLHALMLK